MRVLMAYHCKSCRCTASPINNVRNAVASVGAGRVLPKTASAEEIRAAVASLLLDSSYKWPRKLLAPAYVRTTSAIAAAGELETLLKLRKVPRRRRDP